MKQQPVKVDLSVRVVSLCEMHTGEFGLDQAQLPMFDVSNVTM